MRSIFLAAAVFTGIVGCSSGTAPTGSGPACSTTSTQTMEALISTPSKLTLDRSQNAICTQGWTCDDLRFFATQALCTSQCGSGCFLDFNCNGHCVCP